MMVNGLLKVTEVVRYRTQDLNDFFYFYLFMIVTESERGRDTGRGRSRLHAGSLMWDSILDLQDQALG